MSKVSNLILKGSFLRLFALVLNMAIAFYLMPFIIHSIGDRWYGLWAIVGAIMGYYGLLDFGLSTATQRYIAKSLSTNDYVGVNTAVTTSFVAFLVLGAISVIVSVAIILAGPLFFDATDDIRIFQTVIAILGLKVAISFPLYAFNGVISGKLRFDIASYIQISKLLLRTALFIYYIGSGYSIIALAVVTAVVEVLGYLIMVVFAYRLLPTLRIRPSLFKFKKLVEFVNYGKYVFITSIADIVRFTIDELVITAFMALSFVTHYVIAARLVDYLGQAMAALFGVLMPVFTKDYGRDDWESLRTKFYISTKIAILVSFYMGGLLLVLGDEFIGLWMGDQYLDAYPVLVILVLASVIANSQRPSVGVLYAIAKHKYYSKMTVIEAIFNLALSILLVRHLGMVGVALGTAIPLLITKCYFQPRYTCEQLDISLIKYYKSVFPELLYSTLLLLLLFVISEQILIYSYGVLFLLSSIFSIVYFLIYLKFIIDIDSANYLNGVLPARIKQFNIIRAL
jgi:O-antigen/teichoic acid export membrane protein